MPYRKLANLLLRLVLIRSYSGLCTERVRVEAVRFVIPKDMAHLAFEKPSEKLRFISPMSYTVTMAWSLPKREQNKKGSYKGKSGQAHKTAVSGGFGGGILSQI